MAIGKEIKITESRKMVDLGIQVEVDGKKHRLIKFDTFMSCFDCSIYNHCAPKGEICYICDKMAATKIFIPKEVMNDNVKLINYLKTLKSWKLLQK